LLNSSAVFFNGSRFFFGLAFIRIQCLLGNPIYRRQPPVTFNISLRIAESGLRLG